MSAKTLLTLALVSASFFLLSACGRKSPPATFSDDSATDITPYVDQLASEPINLGQTYNLNQEFKVSFATFDPAGTGLAEFKARSLKAIPSSGDRQPEEGKKLVLVEISVKGNRENKGQPSGFNQIGQTPSPQFVLIDKSKNQSFTEETYYSDAYTKSKKLFELSKITLDHDQWVHTALVFQVDQSLSPDLALRFTNPSGKTEFVDIKE